MPHTFLDDFGGYLFQSWPASCYKGDAGREGCKLHCRGFADTAAGTGDEAH